MQSRATSVEQYLKELPDERRAAISALRTLIQQNVDKVIEEGMQYGMISYFIPHHVFPAGYHCDPTQPLAFVCLASQKNYMSLYLSCVGMGKTEEAFREEWLKTGKRLDMGKSCIRFRKLGDLAMDVVASTIRQTSASQFIERYQASLKENGANKQGRTTTPAENRKTDGKAAGKKTASAKAAKRKL